MESPTKCIRFGEALLGFPPGPQVPEPAISAHLQAPEPWLSEHLVPALDPKAAQALLRTCTKAKALLLGGRPFATALLDLDRSQEAVQSSMMSLQSDMQLRGGKATGLALKQRGWHEPGLLKAITSLAGAGTITTLELPFSVKSVMSAIATAFPNLSKVHIHALLAPLPPPSSLPQLTDLTVGGLRHANTATRASIAPYCGQLTSLGLNWDSKDKPDWPTVFPSSATPSTTIKHFSTDAASCAELLSQLARVTPALAQVTATSFHGSGMAVLFGPLPTVTVTGSLPLCTKVVSTSGTVNGKDLVAVAPHKARPMQWDVGADGKLILHLQAQRLNVCDDVLQSVSITSLTTITLILGSTLFASEYAEALLTALQQLEHLRTPDTELQLGNVRAMTDELAAVLAVSRDQWSKITFVWTTSDATLQAQRVLTSGLLDGLQPLEVSFAHLDPAAVDPVVAADARSVHVGACHGINVMELGAGKQVRVTPHPTPETLYVDHMFMDLIPEVVPSFKEKGVYSLYKYRGCSIQPGVLYFRPAGLPPPAGELMVQPHNLQTLQPVTQQSALASALSTAMSHMPQPRHSLRLHCWAVMRELITLIRSLPDTWDCPLVLGFDWQAPVKLPCTVISKARFLRDLCHQLGVAIPPNYSQVEPTWPPDASLRSQCILAFCEGASSRRTAQQPLHVVDVELDSEDCLVLNRQLRQLGVEAHIGIGNRAPAYQERVIRFAL